ncbi:MAG TPA: aminofutalosine synthase MqnE [Chloroflexota bacterium]|nr:aminofutalosine synthase MqnE [Chloroflexota bacterium]
MVETTASARGSGAAPDVLPGVAPSVTAAGDAFLHEPAIATGLFSRPAVTLPRPREDTLAEIERKVNAGERLSAADGLALHAAPDLLWLGRLARLAQRRVSGDTVYFNINRHINLTNVCKAKCAFCSFRRDDGEDGAYTMTVEEAVETAVRTASTLEITELHIVNGLHPELPFDYYLDTLRRLKAALPHVHLKPFTAVEIWWFARITQQSYESVLRALIDAGLGSLPGGGAEIFAPRVRRRICGYKSTAEDWLEIHRLAHRLGLRTNATMLYGHVETPEERIDHLLRLRALQDETGGFQVFIPLRFHNANNRMSHLPMATALESARVFAISRLMLDNIPHLKAYWIMLGLDTAQTLFEFGVDDLDGTVVQERIYHMAGAATPHELDMQELLRVIKAAGRVPVQRDTVYRTLRVYQD